MDKRLIKEIVININNLADKEVKIMEVCGTHTHAIYKYGIRELISPNVRLISGPGCPVCVTEEEVIDRAIDLASEENVVIATFGDMIRVKGSKKSLMDIMAEGKKVKIIYSPLDVLKLASENRDKIIVFLGVGFETTAPTIAMTIKSVKENDIKNVYFLLSIKRMRPIIEMILNNRNNLQGIICPGHVATITGSEYFKFISTYYKIPAAVCGFEAMDILGGIYFLLKQIKMGKSSFDNLYKRWVREEGNTIANEIVSQIFRIEDGNWRGIGEVKNSAYVLRDTYSEYNALSKFHMDIEMKSSIPTGCQCSDVILGNIPPAECYMFRSGCSPSNPLGPCMVSSEGSCAIYYKYGGGI